MGKFQSLWPRKRFQLGFRADLDKPAVGDRLHNRKANGGGKQAHVRAQSGRIVVS
jgi:hypothetical protein